MRRASSAARRRHNATTTHPAPRPTRSFDVAAFDLATQARVLFPTKRRAVDKRTNDEPEVRVAASAARDSQRNLAVACTQRMTTRRAASRSRASPRTGAVARDGRRRRRRRDGARLAVGRNAVSQQTRQRGDAALTRAREAPTLGRCANSRMDASGADAPTRQLSFSSPDAAERVLHLEYVGAGAHRQRGVGARRALRAAVDAKLVRPGGRRASSTNAGRTRCALRANAR